MRRRAHRSYRRAGNHSVADAFFTSVTDTEFIMGRGLILWFVGIPLPIILLLWMLGFLN